MNEASPRSPLPPSSTTPAPTKPAPAGAPRLAAIDALRGLIMIIMAVDHASAFLVRAHGSEFWTGPWTRYDAAGFVAGPLAFLTRFLTHLCAPGFFFLMGVGMALFAASRQRVGWGAGRISRYFLLRGAVLILVNLLVENRAWFLGFSAGKDSAGLLPPPGMDWLLFSVITGLGMTMIVGGALLIPAGRILCLLAAALAIGCALLVPRLPYTFFDGPAWIRFLLLPGKSGRMFLLYPLLPWLSLVTLGMWLGRKLADREQGDRALRWAPILGLGFIAAALLLRALGGFGNLRPPRDGGWIEFLNFIKYPPALVFALFMVGTNLLLLSLLARLSRAGRPLSAVVEFLAVYGQAPLCFYVAHLFLYATTAKLFYPTPTTLVRMYPVWIAGLIPLYFLCRFYRGFKDRKPPESLWRLF